MAEKAWLLRPRHHRHGRRGYDSLTGAAILLLGCGIGVLGPTINPVRDRHRLRVRRARASTTADRPPRHPRRGHGDRVWWVMRYAARIKADPARSLIAADGAEIDAHFSASAERPEAQRYDRAPEGVLGLFFLAFVVMIIGVVPWADLGVQRIPTHYWWFPEMTASFLLFAIHRVRGRAARDELRRGFRQRRPRPARRRVDHRDRQGSR